MTVLCKKLLGSAFALLIGTSFSMAQGRINEGDILKSLAGTGQAARAANLNLDVLRQDVEKRIQVEGTENAASPPPVLQALAKMPNLTVQIQFDFDSDWIRPASWETIGVIADALHHPLLLSDRFVVVGHTDAKGKRDYNLKLSERRAIAVSDMLISTFRIPPGRLIALGLGEEQLQDQSNPDAGVNRRVQLLNIGPR
ncbi:MAG: OmpA family protein [Hyphomicrobiales bacterium]|nr:OmpA family protein [Hyphomicrobiales bacterium]